VAWLAFAAAALLRASWPLAAVPIAALVWRWRKDRLALSSAKPLA
jgi:hypothetical protein